MEDAFIVQGGKALKGEVSLSGAKNVALKVAIAALLFDTPVTFKNIPHIKDVTELLSLLESLGVKSTFNNNELMIDPTGLTNDKVDLLHGSKTRVSFMLFAPLLHRFGTALIPNPGGCRIGARPIDRHIKMLESFGVTVVYDSSTGYYHAKTNGNKLMGTNFRFEKPTHTGTELAILMATLCPGISRIENVAQEPEIDDLINFLNSSGGQIKRVGHAIEINGVDRLKYSGAPYQIMNDRSEAPTLAVFALATKGDIFIKGATEKDLHFFIEAVRNIGGGVEIGETGIRFYYDKPLVATDITTRPHPGFMTDWQAPWAVLMTQAKGESTIHETVFEDRFGYVAELKKLGARIEYFTPEQSNIDYQFSMDDTINNKAHHQAIRISGPTLLHNGVLEVKDLRAGATVLIAALVAQGESVVNGVSIIDRGYETIDKKLGLLGAELKRV